MQPLKYHRELQCYVSSITYDFARRVGTVWMGENSCTDMAGCIREFERIDADVQRIVTVAGVRLDTSYQKVKDGWTAV